MWSSLFPRRNLLPSSSIIIIKRRINTSSVVKCRSVRGQHSIKRGGGEGAFIYRNGIGRPHYGVRGPWQPLYRRRKRGRPGWLTVEVANDRKLDGMDGEWPICTHMCWRTYIFADGFRPDDDVSAPESVDHARVDRRRHTELYEHLKIGKCCPIYLWRHFTSNHLIRS